MADPTTEAASIIPIITCGAALITLSLTAWQNFWQRGLSERKQELEHRQVQLSLLVQRLAVLDVISKALEKSQFHAEPRADGQDALFSCLLAGQTLFEQPIAHRLQKAWEQQWKYRNCRVIRSMYALDPSKADSYAALDADLDAQRAALFENLQSLQGDMIVASRVPRSPLNQR